MTMDELVPMNADDPDLASPVSQLAAIYKSDDVPLASILDVDELWLTEAIVWRCNKGGTAYRSAAYNAAAVALVTKVRQGLF
jgi:hypothetical protein